VLQVAVNQMQGTEPSLLGGVLEWTHWHESAPTASREGGRVRNVNGATRLHLIEKAWVSLIRTGCADGLRSDSGKGPGCRLEFCFAEQTSRACFVPHGQVRGRRLQHKLLPSPVHYSSSFQESLFGLIASSQVSNTVCRLCLVVLAQTIPTV
jgi:hypothetical protein